MEEIEMVMMFLLFYPKKELPLIFFCASTLRTRTEGSLNPQVLVASELSSTNVVFFVPLLHRM